MHFIPIYDSGCNYMNQIEWKNSKEFWLYLRFRSSSFLPRVAVLVCHLPSSLSVGNEGGSIRGSDSDRAVKHARNNCLHKKL
jgi:hypothetical protein